MLNVKIYSRLTGEQLIRKLQPFLDYLPEVTFDGIQLGNVRFDLATRQDIAERSDITFLLITPRDMEGNRDDPVLHLETLVNSLSPANHGIFLCALPSLNTPGEESEVSDLRRAVRDCCEKIPQCFDLDLFTALTSFGISPGAILAGEDNLIHLIPDAAAVLAATIARTVASFLYSPPKVIVVDCDGTLWGGECGEVPIADLTVNGRYSLLQAELKSLSDRGCLICVASKNDMNNVLSVFREHPAMVLCENDVARWKVSWSQKSTSISELATDLGISESDMIFIDNEEFELREVSWSHPDLLTVRAEEVGEGLGAIWWLDGLKRSRPTDEDHARNNWYRAREQSPRGIPNRSFLEEIRLRVDTFPVSAEVLPRVHQLALRTNQFRNTGTRFTRAAVEEMVSNDSFCYVASVADSVGDYGIVGAMMGRPRDKHLAVSLFVMSCRAFRRYVEDTLIVEIATKALNLGLESIRVRFEPTGRNGAFMEFVHRVTSAGVGFTEGEELVLDASSLTQAPRETFGRPLSDYEIESASIDPGPIPSAAVNPSAGSRNALARLGLRLRKVEDLRGLQEHSAPHKITASGVRDITVSTWRRCLNLSMNNGVTGDFFDMGGDSLQAIEMLYEIGEQLGFDLPLSILFEDRLTVDVVVQCAEALSREAPVRSERLHADQQAL